MGRGFWWHRTRLPAPRVGAGSGRLARPIERLVRVAHVSESRPGPTRLLRAAKRLPLARETGSGYRAGQMRRLLRSSTTPSTGQRLLFWIPGGMPLMLHVEGALAVAAMLRGATVKGVICDGPFRACVRREVKDGLSIDEWDAVCPGCRAATSDALKRMAVPFGYVGNLVGPSLVEALREKAASLRWDDLEDLEHDGIAIGDNVRSAIIRYLQGDEIKDVDDLVKEYALSAMVVTEAARRGIEMERPDRIFMSHGIYADWGPALKVALAADVPVTAWMASYLHGRFFFRHVEDARRIDFHTLSDDAWRTYGSRKLSGREESRLDAFLTQRYAGGSTFDMKRLHAYTGGHHVLRTKLFGSDRRPVWGVMCHINWDAVSDYAPMAYPTFDEWILETIEAIAGLQDVNWVVKIHPAEAWDNPSTGVEQLIRRHRTRLPDHIRVLGAEESVSPMDFFQLIDGGTTVYGTAGLELALLGKPVILAGEAHYGGRGFTHDGSTPERYRDLLSQAGTIGPLRDEEKELARRYAYCYFIRRQIPFPPVHDPDSAWWRFRFSSRHLLPAGRDPFVDFVCDRLLDGGEFLLDDELVELADRAGEVSSAAPAPGS